MKDTVNMVLSRTHLTPETLQDEPGKENEQERKFEMKANQLKTVLDAVAVAMAVAVIVLNIVNPLSLTAVTTLLAIGVGALGVAGLQKSGR